MEWASRLRLASPIRARGWLRSRLLPRSCDVYCMWEMRSPVPLQSLDLRGCLPLCPDAMDQELPAYWFSVKGESVQSTHRVERTPGDPREHSRLSGLGCSTISPLQPASVFRSWTFQLLEHFRCSKGLCLSLAKDIAQSSSWGQRSVPSALWDPEYCLNFISWETGQSADFLYSGKSLSLSWLASSSLSQWL